MLKLTFQGTILSFSSFLKASVKRRQAESSPHMLPKLSVEEPIDKSISEETQFAQFKIELYESAPQALNIVASHLPNSTTLLTITAIIPSQYLQSVYGEGQDTPIEFDSSQVSYLWELILSELLEQGWLAETGMAESTSKYDVKNLRKIFQDALSLSDVRDLCFELDIQFENLGETTLNGAVRELILQMQRQYRIEDLIDTFKQIRPNVDL